MRVRVRDDAASAGFPSAFRGARGTVIEQRRHGAYDMQVSLDSPRITTWFAKGELEEA